YKAADFKKPRNVIGLQKTLPDADMKKALAEHAPADDNALRALAQQRAQRIRDHLPVARVIQAQHGTGIRHRKRPGRPHG
ncbi:hypothetical protein LAN32_26445, partial [Mycobacterium tuberculosis]|nr:hypothetical protein [Mycobacterium tuberculosis]